LIAGEKEVKLCKSQHNAAENQLLAVQILYSSQESAVKFASVDKALC